MLNTREATVQRVERENFTEPTGPHVWKIKGDVEAGVTYESHTFWIEFQVWDKKPEAWRIKARPDATIWVMHGAGYERIHVRHMFARPLRTLWEHGLSIEAHRLCWGIMEQARDSFSLGYSVAKGDMQNAFVDGRLKKRKERGRSTYKVWIEDRAA